VIEEVFGLLVLTDECASVCLRFAGYLYSQNVCCNLNANHAFCQSFVTIPRVVASILHNLFAV